MDIQISTSALVAELAHVADVAAEKKSTIPVLSCVLLTAEQTPEGGRLTVTAYDLELGLSSAHSCEIKTPGSIAIPAKALLEVVRALPSPVTRIKKQANNRVEISSGNASFRMAGANVEEFPKFPEVTDIHYMPAAFLRDAFAKVAFAMSSDETRYNLTGVYLDLPNGNVVSTDGHRMALASGIAKECAWEPVIVAKKAVSKLRKLLASEGEHRGEFGLSQNSLVYRRPGLLMVARLIDGQFPAYQQVMPERTKKPVTVGRAALKECLGRVLLLADSGGVSVTLEDSMLKLAARTADLGDANDSVEASSALDGFKVHLNGSYLMDMLSATDAEKVEIHYSEELAPVLIQPAGDQNHSYVLMPMRG